MSLVKFIKDAALHCKGDIVRLTDDEVKAVEAFAEKYHLGQVYEELKEDAQQVEETVKGKAKAAEPQTDGSTTGSESAK